MPIEHAFNKFECNYCHKIYKLRLMAVGCEQNHDMVFIPFYRDDLPRLIQFLYTGDRDILTERIINTILKYKEYMHGSPDD